MKKNQQTQLIHAPRQAPQLINTIQPPLYRASTIIFDNTDALFNRHWTDEYDYSYGTHGTPTTFTLGAHIPKQTTSALGMKEGSFGAYISISPLAISVFCSG